MNINWNKLAATFIACEKFMLAVFLQRSELICMHQNWKKMKLKWNVHAVVEREEHVISLQQHNSPLNWRAFVQAEGNSEFICPVDKLSYAANQQ